MVIEVAETLAEVLSQIKTKRRNVKTRVRRRLDAEDVSTGFEDVSTSFIDIKSASEKVSSDGEHVSASQREGKAVLEETPQTKRTRTKSREQLVLQEAAQFYTEEDWDTIRVKLEANTDLVKEIAGEDVSEADYAQRMWMEKHGKDCAMILRKRVEKNCVASTESFKKLSLTQGRISIPKEKDKESVKREEEFEIKKPVLRYTKRKSLARKGLQKKPESAKSGTEEDVEAYYRGKSG
ncbi:hypothetical protein Tco_1437052 [Tanacetum coccineum]